MAEQISQFIDKKKALSPFITLKNKESIKVLKVNEIKTVLKQGFNGDEVEVLRLVCDVETSEGTMRKNFDNATQKFAEQLVEKQIGVGSSFTLTRDGEKQQTKYVITDVVNKSSTTANATTVAGAAALVGTQSAGLQGATAEQKA